MTVVVSDASPLHYLIECEAVEILARLFGEVVIPPAVYRELQHERTPKVVREWMEKHPNWLKVQAPSAVDPTLNLESVRARGNQSCPGNQSASPPDR